MNNSLKKELLELSSYRYWNWNPSKINEQSKSFIKSLKKECKKKKDVRIKKKRNSKKKSLGVRNK